MKSFLRSLILVVGLAACSSGPAEPGSQAAASVSEPEEKTASSGLSETEINTMRPETERSRQILLRLKGPMIQRQLRR